jgi:RNA polymerase sigma-70 factor (ECF subfamily)
MNPIESIWKDYHDKLLKFIQSRVPDPSAADDILQEVFLRIHSRIDTLKENNKLNGWIYKITRNAIIDYYRSQKRMEELPEILTYPDSDPSDKTRQEIGSWIQPMIQMLPDEYRDALVMSEIEGLTQKEVGKKLGLSLSGAKSRIQRGRKMVREMLLQCCHFEFDLRGKVIDYEAKTESCTECCD